MKKSKCEQLASRGYLAEGLECIDLPFNEKIKLLQSSIPVNRTLGAKLLSSSLGDNVVNYLISALIVESKLYPKIAICNSLVSFGVESIKPLVKLLGKIGKNQYKVVPQAEFKKQSYPLPRDIASRTLIRFEHKALDDLEKCLDSDEVVSLSEAIDAIGYICFYNCKHELYEKLILCYLANIDNNLIKWKLIRALSAFSESKSFLHEQRAVLQDNRLIKEIDRSLFLIIG